MNYSDAHCHLGSVQFWDDREKVLNEMTEAGLDRVIMICCSERDYHRVCGLRDAFPDFKLACAIHPQSLRETDTMDRFEWFSELVKNIRPDMIGETGLDYASHRHTKEIQKQYFEKHPELACELHLPLTLPMTEVRGFLGTAFQ